MSFADKINTMLETGKLEVNAGEKTYILEMLEDGEIGIEGMGSIWGDDGLIKSDIDIGLVDFIRNLEEFIDYKQNGISFSEVWNLVAEAKELNDGKKLGFAKEFLNLDDEVIEVANRLDELSLDGDVNLNDDEIDNITFDKAKELINEFDREHSIGIG